MPTDLSVTEFAPAKVNLCLHVTGRRADGYHLLDSLVVFAGVGDRVTVAQAPGMTLAITGPQAGALPAGGDNLVLRAATAMGGAVAVALDKVLPVSSGIGGGSADAAATLRAMQRLGRSLPDAAAVLALGADVPVCLAGHPCRMEGVGDRITPLPDLPPFWLVLANPGMALSTPAVFRALSRTDNTPLPALPALTDVAELAVWLGLQRNDLQAPACELAPGIGEVITALSGQTGCLLARMSGSGATCFGLFADQTAARAAAQALARPGWWVAAAPVLGPT